MDDSARTLVIINKTAARARRSWPRIRDALIRNGVGFDTHETAAPGDATTRTRAALRAGCRIIAAVGGDGTLSEVAAGFFEESRCSADGLPAPINPNAALAILPAGTGDDFARGLVGGREPVEKWTAALIAHHRLGDAGKTRMIDVMHGTTCDPARDFICLNVSTLGIGAEVAGRVAAQKALMRRLPGETRFLSAAFGALVAWRERFVRVTVDGQSVIECRSNLIAVANGVYAGGGMMFAPGARVDDGEIDTVLACGITRTTIMRELSRIRVGAHLSNPKVRTMKGTRVRIETLRPEESLPVEADGNVRGRTPAEFRVIPGSLHVVLT